MSIFTLPDGISLDSYDEYESGCIDQRDRCEREARILAFGVIRRAAEVARGCDSVARYSLTGEEYRTEMLQRAYAVRRAIRAAIGSDKA